MFVAKLFILGLLCFAAQGLPLGLSEEDCPLGGYLPHESDCAKFYQCDNGKAVEKDCAVGTWWNQKITVCDWPENVDCNKSDSSSSSSESASDEASNGSEGKGDDSSSSSSSSSEEDSSSSSSSSSSESGSDEGSNGSEGKGDDSSSSSSSSSEEDSSSSSSASGSDEGSNGSGGKGDDDSNGSEGKGDDHSGGDDDSSSSGSGSSEEDCPLGGYLPHESNCSKFYQCDNGKAVEKDCAQGTWWNDKIKVCDWPENTDCSV